MRGASHPWDRERLIAGKLKKYQEIGGKPLTLTTKTGDKISAFDFTVKDFHQKMSEMGGTLSSLELHIDHPFFERAKPVIISKPGIRTPVHGIRIPYDASLESEFKHPKDFLAFCNKMNYTLYWEGSKQPFTPTSWYHFNSMKQNLILVPNCDNRSINNMTPASSITIDDAVSFDDHFSFFNEKPLTSKAIVFEENLDDVERLFTANGGLKIELSSWNMIRHKGKLYILESPELTSTLGLAETRRVDTLSSFRLKASPIRKPKLDAERSTVVLSMNQSNSFASYSHEVLTFLLSGVNVLTYDNAGKGLSKGKNSQQGMTEAIRSTGDYLTEKHGLRQDQIIFKGQCAGGLPSSVAGKIFPRSHIWIDQAPKTFAGAAKDMAAAKGAEMVEKARTRKQRALGHMVKKSGPLVSGLAKAMLPSYNVSKNLKKGKGVQIFTIGVPDSRGRGGDKMVPVRERDSIAKTVERIPHGYYLPMESATHVTDWWLIPSTKKSIDDIFKRFKFSQDVFPEAPKTAKASATRRLETFLGKKFDSKRATRTEKQIQEVYEAVIDQDLSEITHIMHHSDQVTPWMPMGLSDHLSHTKHTYLIDDAIDLSRELGQKLFTQKFLMAKKSGSI